MNLDLIFLVLVILFTICYCSNKKTQINELFAEVTGGRTVQYFSSDVAIKGNLKIGNVELSETGLQKILSTVNATSVPSVQIGTLTLDETLINKLITSAKTTNLLAEWLLSNFSN